MATVKSGRRAPAMMVHCPNTVVDPNEGPEPISTDQAVTAPDSQTTVHAKEPTSNADRLAQHLNELFSELTEKKAHINALQAQLEDAKVSERCLEADAKTHQLAWESEADKAAALSARFNDMQSQKDAMQARLSHVLCMVHDVKKAFIQQMILRQSFDDAGWKELYHGLAVAFEPLLMHTN